MIITSIGYSSKVTFMEEQYVKTSSSSGDAQMKLALRPEATMQTIHGFGGAFTDAVAFNYHRLNTEMQETFVESYFGPSGAGYTVGRVNMGGCDFSRIDYTFANTSGDLELMDFCLRDDQAIDAPCGSDYKIPVIQAAQAAIKRAGSEVLKLFASVWSAPTWYKEQHFTCAQDHTGMNSCQPSSEKQLECTKVVRDPKKCETNGQGEPCPTEPIEGVAASVSNLLLSRARSSLGSSMLEHTVDPKNPKPEDPKLNANGNCYNIGYLSQNESLQDSWALYFSKFIDAYKSFGINMWGLTTQNEPLAATNLWQSMFHNVEVQSNFLANHLGPVIKKNHPEVKMIIHDDQTLSLPDLADKVLDNPEASKYIDGVGYHWYMALQSAFQNEPAHPPAAGVKQLVGGGAYVKDTWKKLQAQDASKFIMMTEACNGYVLSTDWVGPRPGEWGYGYAYSHDVLWQLTNGASGWVDWNLLLDMRGGPNLAGNFVDAPMLVQDADTLIQNPSYFHIAHFAKYVVPGSKQVHIDVACSATKDDYCQAVAFLRPDGNAVVVITNDEVTVGPIGGKDEPGRIILPESGKGQQDDLSWSLTCGRTVVTGTLPWKSIQTVVFPCEQAMI
jgi:O-glycosyl hydrolase